MFVAVDGAYTEGMLSEDATRSCPSHGESTQRSMMLFEAAQCVMNCLPRLYALLARDFLKSDAKFQTKTFVTDLDLACFSRDRDDCFLRACFLVGDCELFKKRPNGHHVISCVICHLSMDIFTIRNSPVLVKIFRVKMAAGGCVLRPQCAFARLTLATVCRGASRSVLKQDRELPPPSGRESYAARTQIVAASAFFWTLRPCWVRRRRHQKPRRVFLFVLPSLPFWASSLVVGPFERITFLRLGQIIFPQCCSRT